MYVGITIPGDAGEIGNLSGTAGVASIWTARRSREDLFIFLTTLLLGIGEFRDLYYLLAILHNPVYTRTSDICSLAAARESSQCSYTPGSMALATCFLASLLFAQSHKAYLMKRDPIAKPTSVDDMSEGGEVWRSPPSLPRPLLNPLQQTTFGHVARRRFELTNRRHRGLPTSILYDTIGRLLNGAVALELDDVLPAKATGLSRTLAAGGRKPRDTPAAIHAKLITSFFTTALLTYSDPVYTIVYITRVVKYRAARLTFFLQVICTSGTTLAQPHSAAVTARLRTSPLRAAAMASADSPDAFCTSAHCFYHLDITITYLFGASDSQSANGCAHIKRTATPMHTFVYVIGPCCVSGKDLRLSPVCFTYLGSVPLPARTYQLGSPLVDDWPIANAVKYRIVSGVVWTNRTMVSSSTDTNRTGVHAVVDIANRIRFPAGSLPDFRMWESGQTMPLVAGFLGGLLLPPAFPFRRYSTLASLHPHRLSRPRCYEPPKSLLLTTRSFAGGEEGDRPGGCDHQRTRRRTWRKIVKKIVRRRKPIGRHYPLTTAVCGLGRAIITALARDGVCEWGDRAPRYVFIPARFSLSLRVAARATSQVVHNWMEKKVLGADWGYYFTTKGHCHALPGAPACRPPVVQSVGAPLLYVAGGSGFESVAFSEFFYRHARLPPRRTGFNPRGRVTGFSQVGIVPDDAVGRGLSWGSPVYPRHCVPVLLHPHRLSGSRFEYWIVSRRDSQGWALSPSWLSIVAVTDTITTEHVGIQR
ncbi:hypothetical protein PR048_022036 [Dryococelus australis]|uniref:Uncharacterized protein n=1 Tax=Dryococelus australis TaxID=614101 RepID=A0ABQ9H048_9NEOP|nr:hypothetical protein PR048_022036 [Dryococelus australis]